MAEWIDIKQYAGFSILDDASKIRTPDGEFDLIPNKLFYFTNPNTGTKNFAKPDVLLARAKKEKKEKVAKEPKTPKEPKVKKAEKEPKITIIGLSALNRAVTSKCPLYYKTDSYGWQICKYDPSEILDELDKPQNPEQPPKWFAHRFGVES